MNLPKLLKPIKSYLTGPRIIFSGRFLADPSTINNDPDNFELAATLSPAEFKKEIQKRGTGRWNLDGTGSWSLVNCEVTGATLNGETITQCDNIIGARMKPGDRGAEGKLVDLDPDNQDVSQIWGFRVRATHNGLSNILDGGFKPTAFRNMWIRVRNGDVQKEGSKVASAMYQSILEDVKWNTGPATGITKELKKIAEESGNALSIKFTVDGYTKDNNNDSKSIYNRTGRIIGVIGQYSPGTPYSFPLGRHLYPISKELFPFIKNDNQFIVKDAVAQLYEAEPNVYKLTIDLCNSLQTVIAGGQPDGYYGDLFLAYKTGPDQYQTIGKEIPYISDPNWLITTGGIYTVTLDPSDALKVAQNAIVLVRKDNGIYKPLLSEAQTPGIEGVAVKADNFVYRLNYGQKQTTEVIATKFGQPLENATIKVEQDFMKEPMILTTDSNGAASFEFTNNGDHEKRDYVDGQAYYIKYYMESQGVQVPPYYDGRQDNSTLINILAWEKFDVPEIPTWKDHIRPIFLQYANLYPVMQKILDLSDYKSVTSNLKSLKMSFAADIHNPHHMPVTRDLSDAKREMILNWLERPVFERAGKNKGDAIKTVDDLKLALQDALVLEMSTIPPYLSALYSIKPGKNVEISTLLRSIVMEEMLHALLVSNVLNAIGGSPDLVSPKRIPEYPGKLPEGVIPHATITLGPLTKKRVKEIFMEIEQPDEVARVGKSQGKGLRAGPPTPIEPPTRRINFSPDPENYTIGDFYVGIKEALKRLNEEEKKKTGIDLFGDENQRKDRAKKQVKTWGHDEVSVIDLNTALSAIDKIVLQGEGTSMTNLANDRESFSHYYKFWEIYEGKRLKASADPNYDYVFGEEDFPFDEGGIYNMYEYESQVKPTMEPYGASVLEQFNEMYARLMHALNDLFNGKQEKFGDAIGIMRNLEVKADYLMQTMVTSGKEKMIGTNFSCRKFFEPLKEERAEEGKPLRATPPRSDEVDTSPKPLFSAPGLRKFKENRVEAAQETQTTQVGKLKSAKPKTSSLPPLTISAKGKSSVQPHKQEVGVGAKSEHKPSAVPLHKQDQ